MKIVNKEEFYKLPKGTLYSNFNPHMIEGLRIKDETISFKDIYDGEPFNYYYVDLIDSIDCEDSEEYLSIIDIDPLTGKEFRMDYNCADRDGYDEGYFVIFDQSDVENLINTLIKVRDKTYE